MRPLLEANLNAVRTRIADACRAAGRPVEEVQLLAVTKSVPATVAAELYDLGVREFGENRFEPFSAKLEHFDGLAMPAPPRWHWIGHLQRNKARRVLERADTIHSIDSERLLESAGRMCGELGLSRKIYLQVKLTDEATKHGLEPSAVPALLARAAELPGLAVEGLMGMAPRLESADGDARRPAARRAFAALRELSESLDPAAFANRAPRLSMGMTGDLEEAVLEGSHLVRVGTALFDGLDPLQLAGAPT